MSIRTMISNKKLELLKIWEANPFASFSISEIMKLSKRATKTWVFNALKLLVKDDILISERKGNINIYSLNISNPVSVELLQYLETQANINFPQLETISNIIEKAPIKNFCLVVFGSYAELKQTKKSDLDICFLIESKELEKIIKPYINDIKLGIVADIDDHYITFDDFIEMLLRSEENLGKQIFRSHRLFFNHQIYYQLLKEAYKNGFRP